MLEQTKPSHLSAEYGAWFRDPLIAEAYPYRPPYPDDVISQIVWLASQASPGGADSAVALDLGAGTGDLARRLAPHVARVDAVDASTAMMDRWKALPGGSHPHVRWIVGMAEEVPLAPPYTLATAGESLHWMDWDVVLPRIAGMLAPAGMLAIASRDWEGPPILRERLLPIFGRYSPVRDYRPFDVVAELASRGLFAEAGRRRCGPAPWTPTVAEYVACRHSQRGFSRTHMGPVVAAAFDASVVEVLEEICRSGALQERDGRLQLEVRASVVWGRPAPAQD